MRMDQAARSLLGVPFRHLGRNPRIALDCVGLLKECLVICGEHLLADTYDLSGYSRTPSDGILDKQLAAAFGKSLALDQIQAGDVVSMRNGSYGPSCHVAIVAEYVYGGLSIIHTSGSVQRVVECRFDVSQLVALYRIAL